MNKPTSMVINEMQKKIADDINATNLPMYLVEPFLKQIYEEVVRVGHEQAHAEEAEYKNSLLEETKKEDTE